MNKLFHLFCFCLFNLIGVCTATSISRKSKMRNDLNTDLFLDCGLPGLPVAGLINTISDWSDGINFSPGTQVGYSCTGNGRMFGESIRECTVDGQWTGSAPLCGKFNRIQSE
jgi:hypothetical protein